MMIEQFWDEFLRHTGKDRTTRYLEAFHFELSEAGANGLLELVLAGTKRATASSLWAFEAEGGRIPQKGDYSIVTDWTGNPKCVIKTTCVTVLPFREMTFEICKREGEDENLASWKEGHTRFFTREGEALGYRFAEDMPVVFEDFEVVYVK